MKEDDEEEEAKPPLLLGLFIDRALALLLDSPPLKTEIEELDDVASGLCITFVLLQSDPEHLIFLLLLLLLSSVFCFCSDSMCLQEIMLLMDAQD